MVKPDHTLTRPKSLPAKLKISNKGRFRIYPVEQIEYDKDEIIRGPCNVPCGLEILTNQVAGHMSDGKSIGMLKYDGKVLKPVPKLANEERETNFYEELQKTSDKTLLELKEFVPQYYGTQVVSLDDRDVKCIVLENLTRKFREPCIMDIKIGRRTWDPLATYEKIIAEDNKYHATKRDLGFCIPGFQVYKISSSRVSRYDKEYGRQLNKETVEDAFKLYLNASSGLNRNLLLQLLVNLWRILHWARRQRKMRLYSSSLLLIYDAKRLKQCLQKEQTDTVSPKVQNSNKPTNLYKPLSLLKINECSVHIGFSGQFSHDGPILRSPTSPSKIISFSPPNSSNSNGDSAKQKSIPTLKRVHSFNNNFDKDLQNLKREYACMLDELITEEKDEVWATVKMIDFAHVFPAENHEADTNYIEGLENVVKILERFLNDTK